MKFLIPLTPLLIFSIIAFGQDSALPQEITWHAHDFSDVKISAEGGHLATLDNSGRLIISDLRKRTPIFEYQQVAKLLVSSKRDVFYAVNNRNQDYYGIQQRSFVTGQLTAEFQIPKRSGEYQIRTDPFALALKEGEANDDLLVVYSNGSSMNVQVFDIRGNVSSSYEGFPNEPVNTMFIHESRFFVLSNKGLYQHENGKSVQRITATGNQVLANARLRGDTLCVLSNRDISYYNIRSWSKIQSMPTPFFAVSQEDLNKASVISYNHPFEVDDKGNCWIVDTRIVQRNGSQNNDAKRRYMLARISPSDVDYPLFSREIAYDVPFAAVENEFDIDISKNVIAFSPGGNQIIIQHLHHGELFRFGTQRLIFTKLNLTDKPGRLLLQTWSAGLYSPVVFLDLANGRQDPALAMEKKYRSPGYRSSYKMTGVREKIHGRWMNEVERPEYVSDADGTYLAMEQKERYRQDTLKIALAEQDLELAKESGLIRWRNKSGKTFDELQLKNSSNQAFERPSDYFDRFSYDSISGLLAVSFLSSAVNHGMQYIIDVRARRIVKKLTTQAAVAPVQNGKYYVSEKGFLNFKDDKLISSFPEGLTPDMRTYDIKHYRDSVIMVYKTWQDELVWYNLTNGRNTTLESKRDVTEIVIDRYSDKVFTLRSTGVLDIWSQHGIVGTVSFSGNGDAKNSNQINPSYVIRLSDGYFIGANRYYEMISLRKDGRQFSVQALDAQFNRPDKVFARLGYSSSDFVSSITNVLEKRRGVLSSASGDVSITNKNQLPFFADDENIIVKISSSVALKPGQGIMVYVNGTALWPKPGKTIAEVQSLKIKLVDGVNHIRTILMDANGSETPGDFVLINSTAITKRNLYAVTIGVSNYLNPSYNLKYAVKDAQEIDRNVRLLSSYVEVKTKNFYDLQVDSKVVNEIRQFLKAAEVEDQVLIFYAGHGLLDKESKLFLATHDISFTDPGKNGIMIDELIEAVSESPARKKLVMIDACNSGLIDDLRIPSDGVADITLPEDLTIIQRGIDAEVPANQTSSTIHFTISSGAGSDGVSVLAAAAGNEAALEGGGIRNGFFTYSFIKALESGKANLNKDEQISLNELQTFISDEVRKLSKGRQRPSFRQANIYYDAPLLRADDALFSHFINAVILNKINFVNRLIADGKVDINQRDKQGYTAIHYSAREGHFQLTKLLLSKGANINADANRGTTPAFLAAYNGHFRVLFLLALEGADVAALKTRADLKEQKNVKILQLLTDFPSIREYERRHFEFLKSLCENVTNGETLMAEAKIDINHKSIDGYPLLLQTLAANKDDCSQWLIDHHADVNAASEDDMLTPLMAAAYHGNVPLIKKLLERKADKSFKDAQGRTASDYAKTGGHQAAADLLEVH